MGISAEQYVPQTTTTRRPFLVWCLLLVGSLLFVAAIIGAPIATASGNTGTALTIYNAFHNLCHQLPERSYYVAGHPLAVCARCTGVYLGFALAVLAYPLVRSLRRIDTPERKWLFVASIPLVVDFSLNFLGVWENTHTSRSLTGALLGATAVFYVLPGLIDLALNSFRRKPRSIGMVVLTDQQIATAPSDYSAPHRRI